MTANESSPARRVVSADFAALVDQAGHFFADCAAEAVAQRGWFRVALSGGSTPRGLHQALAGETTDVELKQRVKTIPWAKTVVYFGDERYVPPDHPDSNYRMARETLLNLVPIPPEQIHPMPTNFDVPAEAAAAYTQTLQDTFQTQPGEWPQFDLILLGMGPDGHTASLFPGTAAIHEQTSWVVSHFVPKLQAERMTLTPPVLCAARQVAFLVSGSENAAVLQRVLEGPFEPDVRTSQSIRPTSGTLTWFLDEAAAAKLSK